METPLLKQTWGRKPKMLLDTAVNGPDRGGWKTRCTIIDPAGAEAMKIYDSASLIEALVMDLSSDSITGEL